MERLFKLYKSQIVRWMCKNSLNLSGSSANVNARCKYMYAAPISRGSSSSNNDSLGKTSNHIHCAQKHFEYLKTLHNSQQNLVLLRQELHAFSDILKRSGFTSHSIGNLYNVPSRSFSSSSQRCQNGRNDDKNDDKDDKDKIPMLPKIMAYLWIAVGLAIFNFLIMDHTDDEENSPFSNFVTWNEFVHDMLSNGEVEEVLVDTSSNVVHIKLHPDAVLRGKKVIGNIFRLKFPDANTFERKLRKAEDSLGIAPGQGIPVSYRRANVTGSLPLLAIIGIILYLSISFLRKSMPASSEMFMPWRKAKFVRVDQQIRQYGEGIRFKDVAGLKEAKIEIMEFVDYLKQPEKFKQLGARVPRGALLLGPPGCGKTLLAKAVANEAKVPFLAMAGSEFVEMIGGLGAARVRDLFKEARENAPCIIYLDEVDAIGRKRGGTNNSGSNEEEQTLNQLLVEMDGMTTTEGVIMLASTNRADVLDKALLRPGRFDRHITIDLPTLIERKEIFTMYLEKLAIAQPASTYADKLAQLSPGMSGADIANICNEAALYAARMQKTTIDTADFDYAVERVVAGVAKKSRVLSEMEKKVLAYHEAGHALVGWMLKHTDALLRVSIVPRTGNTLGFAQYMPTDKKLHSQEEIFDRMCMALGGRVAESLIFNNVTTGAQDDLQKVTKMAYTQIRVMGMNERVGQVSFPPNEQGEFGGKPFSRKLANLIDEEAKLLVARAYKHTETLLLDHKDKLIQLAEVLLEKEALSYEDVLGLIGPSPYGDKKILAEDIQRQTYVTRQ